MNDAIFKFFADYIKKEIGIIYSEANQFQLEIRLNQICKALNFSSIPEFHAKVQKDGIQPDLKELLLDTATNNETSFFRDIKIFRAFEKYILPSLVNHSPRPKGLRIWSVASSFGQEAYSIAMILQEIEEQRVPMPPCEILTTDLSTRALNRVNKAEYSTLEVQRGLPAQLLVKYFEKLPNDFWRINSAIRNRVQTAKVNLLKISGVSGSFNVIFCRNVLIYQEDLKKKEIISELSKYLCPGGYLILGAAESLINISTEFEQISYENAFFYKKI